MSLVVGSIYTIVVCSILIFSSSSFFFFFCFPHSLFGNVVAAVIMILCRNMCLVFVQKDVNSARPSKSQYYVFSWFLCSPELYIYSSNLLCFPGIPALLVQWYNYQVVRTLSVV